MTTSTGPNICICNTPRIITPGEPLLHPICEVCDGWYVTTEPQPGSDPPYYQHALPPVEWAKPAVTTLDKLCIAILGSSALYVGAHLIIAVWKGDLP